MLARAKTLLRVGGVAVVGLGLMFLPREPYIFTARDLGLFNNLADYGAFTRLGWGFIAVGLIAFGASFLLKGDLTD